ncbi:MAG: PAS domain-containing protein [Verrucomicrobiia bacterium]
MRPYSLEASAGKSAIKVLLVDDDENSYLLTRRLLSKLQRPFHVDWADSYQAGLEVIAKKRHDVYLLDYRLGAYNGLDLLKEALALGCKAPMIILTTENPDVDTQAMTLGAADFLNKDRLDSALLERSIRYSINQFATLRALREREAQLASFMQNVPGAFYMKDLEGRYVYVNETWQNVFHRGKADWHGRTDDELWPKPLAQKFKDASRRILTEMKAVETTAAIPQGGDVHYWLVTTFPILNEQGSPIMAGGAAVDITEQKRLEKQVQEVSEQEKRRIGQDLHDGLGQYLTGIAFMSRLLQRKLAEKELPEALDAEKIATLVNKTVFQARDLARGLCPVELENNGLHAALLDLSATTEKVFNISCSVECAPAVRILDNNAALNLYRIAQEAINNAIKHGKAQRIVVSLAQSNRAISLSIKDDGVGFPKSDSKSNGIGLRVMNYRAAMIGGTLSIEKQRTGGTVVTCQVQASSAETAAPAKKGRSPRAAKAAKS